MEQYTTDSRQKRQQLNSEILRSQPETILLALYFDLSTFLLYSRTSSFCAMKMISRICFVLLLALPASFAKVKCPNIIGRTQWTNVPAGDVNYLIVPIPYVIIQHTVTPECDSRQACTDRVENIRSYHMDSLSWDDIGYSFLIGDDGNVYEGCGWTREGAHTYGYNKKSVGIAFIGNFENKDASQRMLNTAHQLIKCGKSQGILRNNVRVLGARQVGRTASPGNQLYTQIQDWPEWSSEP